MIDRVTGRFVLASVISVSAHAGIAFVATQSNGPSAPSDALESTFEISVSAAEPLPPPMPSPPMTEEEPRPAKLAPSRHPMSTIPSHLPSAPVDPGNQDAFAAAPSVVEAPAGGSPRFVMSVGRSNESPGGATTTDGGSATFGVASSEPVPEGMADSPAELLAGSPPPYTREAEAAGVEADVPLEIVVGADGAVCQARPLARVGYGLDDVALKGVRQYRFRPAARGGKPIAVRMRWLMRFQLR